jgi:hypothetical protein
MKASPTQLALDFGEHRIWTAVPEGRRQECRERLARMLLRIVEAEQSVEEVIDDRG